MHHHIALIGKSRSGKDTVAEILTERASYTRLAFADRLKKAALQVDPIVYHDCRVGYRTLADIVRAEGWERAKDGLPEVRRFLQDFGQAMREIDDMVWVRPVADQVRQGTRLNMPCVVSDVRYANEVTELQALGAVTVRVTRPGAGLQGDAGAHSSETELDDMETDITIDNNGTLAQLYATVASRLVPALSER